MSPELETALVTLAAVVVAQLAKGVLRVVQSWVRRTPTSFDDKVWAAVSGAVLSALEEHRKTENEKPPLADAVASQRVGAVASQRVDEELERRIGFQLEDRDR